MIGGASAGASYRLGDADVSKWVRTRGGASHFSEVAWYTKGIGRTTYRSIAPRLVLRRTPGAKLQQRVPLGANRWPCRSKWSAHGGLAEMDRGATGNLGSVEIRSVLALLQVIGSAAIGKDFRLLGEWAVSAERLALKQAFSGRRPLCSSVVPKRFKIARRVRLGAEIVVARSGRATDALPSVAPSAVAGRIERLFHKNEHYGSLQHFSPIISRNPKDSQNDPAARWRTAIQHGGDAFAAEGRDEQPPISRASAGRAIERFFDEQVRLPPSGIGGFDPRLSPAWAGL